jgi:hypothetical protein
MASLLAPCLSVSVVACRASERAIKSSRETFAGWLLYGPHDRTVSFVGEIRILADTTRTYLQYEPGNSGSVKHYLHK